MGAPLTYEYALAIFGTRRKSRDFKAYKTDTHLKMEADGTLMFTYVSQDWIKQPNGEYKSNGMKHTPMVSITPDNVVTLLMGTEGWPSAAHMTIRNRMQDITGFTMYSDTAHHKNKETAIRIEGRRYDNGWCKQPWCTYGSLPYAQGTQFKTITNGKNGGLTECLNPPKDMKKLVKQEAIQQAKGDTAIIRKLAKVMLRVGFEEHIEKKVDGYYYAQNVKAKPIYEVNYKNPSGDDAFAVLKAGLVMANRPDAHVWSKDEGKYIERPRDVRVQILRERVLENGMKALRQHIYETTNGYEKVEA